MGQLDRPHTRKDDTWDVKLTRWVIFIVLGPPVLITVGVFFMVSAVVCTVLDTITDAVKKLYKA